MNFKTKENLCSTRMISNDPELMAYSRELDDFLKTEKFLLEEQIQDIQETLAYYQLVVEDFKSDPAGRKKLIMKAAKEMLSTKLNNFREQERMLIFALNCESRKLAGDIDKIILKYGLI